MIVLIVLLMYLLFSVYVNQTYTINEGYSIWGVILISIFVIRYTQKNFKEYAIIITIGYLLRLLVLFLDYYKIVPIPCSGADSEMFYRKAFMNALDSTNYNRTNFTLYLTSLFEIIGPQRLFAQFINVLFSFCTIIYTCKSLRLIDLEEKSIKKALFFVCFLPQMLFLSSILLRESMIICCTTISVYYYIKSIIYENRSLLYISIITVLIAAYMHSGMIGVLFGYLFSYTFYNYKNGTYKINIQSMFLFSLSIVFFLIIVIQSGLFTDYFESFLSADSFEESEEVLLDKYSRPSEAGSAYLTWLDKSNPLIIYLTSPLRMFYFLFSPIPFDWRNIMDIITFFLDSACYMYLLYKTIGYLKDNRKTIYSRISYSLLIGFVFFTFIYSLGTCAAGTAARHRTKCFPLLVIVAGILKKENSITLYNEIIECNTSEI